MVYHHPRDLIGYGANPPDPKWPGGAKLAVSFVLNYEEGGEYAIPSGDDISETYLLEVIGYTPTPGKRLLGSESIFEYGSRCGVWRIKRMFDERRLPLTVFAVGQAVEANPAAIRALHDAGHEIASHHYRWIDYGALPEQEEREHVARAVEAIEKVTGHAPVGIYGGRTGLNSRRLFAEQGGFLYESDAYNDDLPYWVDVGGRRLLIIPYMLDNNDFKFCTLPTWGSAEAFFQYNKATFDFLYRESDHSPKMISVGLHCRISGRPGRAEAVARLLDYVQGHKDVWICRRDEIARHWRQHFS